MIWVLLTPREEEAIMQPVPPTAKGYNAETVRMVQAKIDRHELELTEEEYQRVRRSRRDWKGGYERTLQAVLDAAARH